MNEKKIWINGIEQKELSAFDRGLAYGHGVFETILFRDQSLYLLDLHLQRLAQGLECLGIKYSLEVVQEDLQEHILTDPTLSDGIVKIIITAGESERGYAWPQPMRPTQILMWSSYDDVLATQLKRWGAHLLLSSLRLAHQPLLAGIKHLNRLEQVLIRQEVDLHQCDEALVLNGADQVIEANSANIFIIDKSGISTPSLDGYGVAGVMRRYLLETVLPSFLLPITEKIITLEELCQAEEVFLTNSIWGIVPVVELKQADEQEASSILQRWSIGAVTQNIQQALLNH